MTYLAIALLIWITPVVFLVLALPWLLERKDSSTKNEPAAQAEPTFANNPGLRGSEEKRDDYQDDDPRNNSEAEHDLKSVSGG